MHRLELLINTGRRSPNDDKKPDDKIIYNIFHNTSKTVFLWLYV